MKSFKFLRSPLFCLLVGFTFSLSSVGQEKEKPTSSETKSETKQEKAEGKVTTVIDGDSIKVKTAAGKEYEVQIEGTDAPESKQPFGKESTEALSKLVKDKDVKLVWEKTDTYGRLLAQVYVEDKHINLEMIKNGWAWHFKRYNKSKELAAAEESARKEKKGLWTDENPTAPWDYRKENKSPDKPN